MKKNIIILSNLDIWSIEEGKGAPSFFYTLKAYVDDKWNVTLIQPTSKYRKDYKVDGCKMLKFNNTFFDYLNSIPKVRFFARFFAHIYATRMFVKKSKEIIKKDETYIIYAYEIFGVKAGNKIAKKHSFPFVTRFQGTILSRYKNTLFNWIRKYPHFHALSQESNLVIMTDDGTKGKEILDELGNASKILFIKNGQNSVKSKTEVEKANIEIRKKYKIDMNNPIFLTVSRLQNWKKVDRAILLLKEVLTEYPTAKLIIVGDGEEYDNLVELSKKEKITNNVVFVGSIKQEEVWKYYSCANIFLSLYDLSNMGNPLMEAMRYGKAIITINNGDTKTIIKNKETGILVSPNKLNTLSNEALKLLSDSTLLKKLGEKAKMFADKNFLSWDERMKIEIKMVEDLTRIRR